jgi:phage nucleotide-binding protein
MDTAVLDALLAEIAPVEDKHSKLKVLIYGDPGTGKTVLAAGAPAPLLIDVEGGSLSLRNHSELSTVEVMRYVNVKQLELFASAASQSDSPFDKYESIIIDTFSELQKRDLDDIVKAAARKDPSRDPNIPIGPDYNKNTEHLRQIAAAFRDLDKHLIVICHAKEEKDERTGTLFVRPNLTPKLASTMAGIFDIVGYMSATGEGETRRRTLQVHPSPSIQAKTRIGNLPTVIENPSFETLLDAANLTQKVTV